MPEDIYYNENFRTEFDAVGDIRTHTGEDAVQQAIATSVIEYRRETPNGLTPTDLEERRSAIEDAVRGNTFTEPPVTVTITDVDYRENTVTYQVTTDRRSFPLTI